MGNTMDHTLINPNQLRHFGTKIQDDPTSDRPLSIITEDNEFCMELAMAGTIVHANTHSPTDQELHSCPHIVISSPQSWDPHKVTFPACRRSLDKEIGGLRHISAISTLRERLCGDEDIRIFNLDCINRCILAMKVIEPQVLRRNKDIDPGLSDTPASNTFTSTERHSDVTP